MTEIELVRLEIPVDRGSNPRRLIRFRPIIDCCRWGLSRAQTDKTEPRRTFDYVEVLRSAAT
jgi:hypothetical protein